MLIEPLLQLLRSLKLHGMHSALERQPSDPDIKALRFEERMSLLLQHQLAERDNERLTQRLRVASLPQPACLEDLDTRIARNLDPALISTVRDLGWIERHLNVLITGPTGIGKSFIGAALAHAACRANYHCPSGFRCRNHSSPFASSTKSGRLSPDAIEHIARTIRRTPEVKVKVLSRGGQNCRCRASSPGLH